MKAAPGMGEVGAYIIQCFGNFNFEGITLTPPTRTFEDHMNIKVGDKEVNLIEVGLAHARGDILLCIPKDRTVFTGDILFIEGTPIMWAGPVANFIQACNLILAMDVETIVPGHGPITDKRGVEAVKGYFEYIQREQITNRK
jgi:cyclase